MSEGLAQGPYVAAGVGFAPATLRTQSTEPITEPPCPISIMYLKTSQESNGYISELH